MRLRFKHIIYILLLAFSVASMAQSAIPRPDNMDSSLCMEILLSREWSIQNSWSSGGGVSNHNTPMVGDLDDDGVPEIMCFGSSGETDNNGLLDCTVLVYDGMTKQQKANFRMPVYVTAYDAGAYGLVKLPSRKGLIIVAGNDCYLRAFDISSSNPATPYWVSDQPYGSGNQFAVNVSFADFNNDGYPEIAVRNNIFDAETGVLLATATGGSNTGASYAHYSHRTGRTLYSPMVANIVGDERQELILGNEIYDVRITNRGGTAGNTVTLLCRIDPPSGVVQDGHAQVADFNLDGHLDIFISNKDIAGGGGTVSMYVWDVYHNRVSSAARIPCNMSGKSLPLIANIDSDPQLEVTIQCAASGVGNQRVRTYKYNAISNQFEFMWGFPVDEDSYSNGMTAFDFNLDGVNEMLICDQSTMRAVDGAGNVLNSFRFSETTIMQYPVIADVDCDGHAEIVSVGSGRLNVFKSNGQPWAPARSVWNQYVYNITCVNNDLTVPCYYYNNSTAYIDPDDGTVRRPFNNCLQQTTNMDYYGRPFYGLPDVVPINASATFADHQMNISATYRNQGSISLKSPYYITLYANRGIDSIVAVRRVEVQLLKDSVATFTFSLPTLNACHPPFDGLLLSLNDDGHGPAMGSNTQSECDSLNNQYYIPLPKAQEKIVYIDTQRCDSIIWHETGDTYTASGIYVKTIEAHDGCDSLRKLRFEALPSYYIVDDTSCCEPFVWHANKQAYHTSASDVAHFVSSRGCDSVWLLNYTILYDYFYDTVVDTICYGERYWLFNRYVDSEGKHIAQLYNQHGCDTFVTLYLNVRPPLYTDFDSVADCEGLTYTLTRRGEERDDVVLWWSSMPRDTDIDTLAYSEQIVVNPSVTTAYWLNARYAQGRACATNRKIILKPLRPLHAEIHKSNDLFTPYITDIRLSDITANHESCDWYVNGAYYGSQTAITLQSFDETDTFDVALVVISDRCTDTARTRLYFKNASLYVPNVFTPDAEKNNLFYVGAENISDYEIHIYSREGLLVFHSENITDSWNGTLTTGTPAPQGVYTYIIRYRNSVAPDKGLVQTGTVLLLR